MNIIGTLVNQWLLFLGTRQYFRTPQNGTEDKRNRSIQARKKKKKLQHNMGWTESTIKHGLATVQSDGKYLKSAENSGAHITQVKSYDHFA